MEVQGEVEAQEGRDIYIYIYIHILMADLNCCGRNQHNIVKQLSSS